MNEKKAKHLRKVVQQWRRSGPTPADGLISVNTAKVVGQRVPAEWNEWAPKLLRLVGTPWFREARRGFVPVYATTSVNIPNSARWLYRKLKSGS